MKRYTIHTGTTKQGNTGYALKPKHEPDPSTQPITRKDILDLQENLTWPPAFMRDVNIVEMEKHRKAFNASLEDPSLDPTSKLLTSSYHAQLFSLYNKKFFGRDSKGSEYLPSSREPTQSQNVPQGSDQQQATPSDVKQTSNLIPRHRGAPLSVAKSVIQAPPHRRKQGEDIILALKSPNSGISWDSQGKLIDLKAGVKGQGKTIQGSNIQDIIGYATSPDPRTAPPKGYDLFRSVLLKSGVSSLLAPESEKLYSNYKKKKLRTIVKPRYKKQATIVNAPLRRGVVRVERAKLKY
jgi:hypothetical protein